MAEKIVAVSLLYSVGIYPLDIHDPSSLQLNKLPGADNNLHAAQASIQRDVT